MTHRRVHAQTSQQALDAHAVGVRGLAEKELSIKGRGRRGGRGRGGEGRRGKEAARKNHEKTEWEVAQCLAANERGRRT